AGITPIGDDGYFQTAHLLETMPNPTGFSFSVLTSGSRINISPDQMTMFRDAPLDIENARLIKIDTDDATALASLSPELIRGQVLMLQRAHAHWGDVLERLYALRPALIIRLSRTPGRSDGAATRRLIDPDNRADVDPPETTPVPLMEVTN